MKYTDLVHIQPQADPRAVLTGDGWRVTVLTSRLLRLEYEPNNAFMDSATQMAVNRCFPVPTYTTREENGRLVVETEHIRLFYDRKAFSETGLYAVLKGQFVPFMSVWHYGEKPNTLKGTARTLDEADGEIPLEEGLNSLWGYSVIDDSRSMAMDENGCLHSAPAHGEDLYLFAYGHDFKACLKDFMHLSGPVPVVPRFALGNWWSRFYPYTQQEYTDLMNRFKAEGVPLSVSVLDMDWHQCQVPERFGTGWTGYTFDRKLIPDPEGFMQWLHDMGLKVTVNDHPADGVRACEEWYPAMAREMGIDPDTEAPMSFDASSEAYFAAFEKCVMTPLEKMGVDFWWIDWQQKGGTTDPGVDPLFMLNHRYYRHALEKGKARLTFSRYGGPGSHRYPIGFSGDSCITWDSLAFQPYFTANAANIAYGWWSHDIGGHMHGTRDGELSTRWVQLGAFLPINRLHSSRNRFMDKEPWQYPIQYRAAMTEFLRLRHRLLPFLYTQNVLASQNCEMMLRPVYFDYPQEHDLVLKPDYRNEYLLGDCLLVSPIIEKADPATALAAANTLLPAGGWYDLFTGDKYQGGRAMKLYRTLDTIPVLAREGAILPMDAALIPENGAQLPHGVRLCVFTGASGEGRLIEDNGLMPGEEGYLSAVTRFSQQAGEGYTLSILPVEGEASLLPENRRYTVALYGFDHVLPDEASCPYTAAYDEEKRALVLTLEAAAREGATLIWHKMPAARPVNKAQRIQRILRDAQVGYDSKEAVLCAWERTGDPVALLAFAMTQGYPESLIGALAEGLMVE